MLNNDELNVLTTIRDLVRRASSEFLLNELSFGHGFSNALEESRYLVLHALGLPFDWPESYLDCHVTVSERQNIMNLVKQRVESRLPVAYMTNQSWFAGLEFYVDNRVLVPRSPIAELIARHFEPWVDSSSVSSILDLCCGSGCIGIAAQYAFFDADVCVADLSTDALEVCRINLDKHDLTEHVAVFESDLFDDIPQQTFDLILCNPPYVDAEDMSLLTPEFKHEPELGLAAGDDGLILVGRILRDAGRYLTENGKLFLEVGNSQAAMMAKYHFLPMSWVEFEQGGLGVCMIEAPHLHEHQVELNTVH